MKHFLSILIFALPLVIDAQILNEIPIESIAIASLTIKDYPDFLVANENDVWVTNKGRVEKMQWGKEAPVFSVSMPEPCGVMCVAYQSLWVASCKGKSVYRIDPATGKIKAVIASGLADPEGELSIAAGADAIWLLSDGHGILSKINPTTNTVVSTIKVKANSYAVAFGFGNVWITNTSNASVQRVDPVNNKVIGTIKVGNQPRFLATGFGSVWTLNQADGTVTRIDPNTNQTIMIDIDAKGSGGDITAGSKYIYVRAKKILLTVIDPITNKIVKRYGPPAGSGAVAVENGRVWITAHDINKVWILNE